MGQHKALDTGIEAQRDVLLHVEARVGQHGIGPGPATGLDLDDDKRAMRQPLHRSRIDARPVDRIDVRRRPRCGDVDGYRLAEGIHRRQGSVDQGHDVADIDGHCPVGAVQNHMLHAVDGADRIAREPDGQAQCRTDNRHVQAPHRTAPEARGNRMRRSLETCCEQHRDLVCDPRNVRRFRGRCRCQRDAHCSVQRALVLVSRAFEANRLVNHPEPQMVRGMSRPAQAFRVDVFQPVLSVHGAADEGWQRTCTPVGYKPDPHRDAEFEAVGRAVNQLDARH